MAHSPVTPRTLRNLSEVREFRKKDRSVTPEIGLTSRKLQQVTADWASFKIHSKARVQISRVNASPTPASIDLSNSQRLAATIKSASALLQSSRSLSTPRSKLLFEKKSTRSPRVSGPLTFTMAAKLKQFEVTLTSADVERGRKRKAKTFEVSLYD